MSQHPLPPPLWYGELAEGLWSASNHCGCFFRPWSTWWGAVDRPPQDTEVSWCVQFWQSDSELPSLLHVEDLENKMMIIRIVIIDPCLKIHEKAVFLHMINSIVLLHIKLQNYVSWWNKMTRWKGMNWAAGACKRKSFIYIYIYILLTLTSSVGTMHRQWKTWSLFGMKKRKDQEKRIIKHKIKSSLSDWVHMNPNHTYVLNSSGSLLRTFRHTIL